MGRCVPFPDMTQLPLRFSSLLSAWVALTVASLLSWSTGVHAQDAARGSAVLALARQALGGKGLDAVKTLQVTGTFRRVVGGNDTEGDFDVFIEVPDKY